jgi:phage baseplate assembly protein W
MGFNRFLLSDNWAQDLSKNGTSEGELKDISVLDQSIELILTTVYGERLFNLSFGCGLTRKAFETMTPGFAENILNDVSSALKRWEDRIQVLESQMRIIQNIDANTIIIVIPYYIKKTGISSIFKKKLVNY